MANNKLKVADNLLLVGVVAIVALVVIGLVASVIHTIIFAIKVLCLVVVVAVGFRVVKAISGGDKPRELKR